MTAMEADPRDVLLETGLLELEAVLERLHDFAASPAEQALAIPPELPGRDSQPES